MFRAAPYFPLPHCPKVSVVVASYNGERTLKACLESLERLNYPDYEVILVDDGSTDTTPQIAAAFPNVRYIRHEKNLGLSVARNTGIAAATGEIIAFTDCGLPRGRGLALLPGRRFAGRASSPASAGPICCRRRIPRWPRR